jgi:hypothetical protein
MVRPQEAAVFVSPIDREHCPGKRSWDNLTIYDRGKFYAFFGTGIRSDANPNGHPNAIDIAVSDNGVRWRWLARDLLPIPGAHAGFGVCRVGDHVYYYPTCSNKQKGVHFKIYSSTDLVNWEHLGDERDVVPDRRYYSDRWDEMHVLADREGGRDVYYGYISSEVREDIGAPSMGLLRSFDGVSWEVLPPPVVEWGEVPSHHMELNFCERIGGRYYVSMSGRFYMDSYGYSLYTFVGDSPCGPFRPDREMLRLAGTSRRNVTWLGHTLRTPDGLLVALWLSAQPEYDLPSDNFGIGPLKRLCCENGHLRLRYWPGNERAKGAPIPLRTSALRWVHPAPAVKTDRDTLTAETGAVLMSASRDGSVAVLDHCFSSQEGFVLEGALTVRENRGHIASHQHAAGAGVFLESGPGTGCGVVADTLGVTRIGTLTCADHRITEFDIYAHAGTALVRGRSGELQGTSAFECEDTVGPFGHAAFCGVRHGREHAFRLVARGEFFEWYVDDYYVQTWTVPPSFTGRIGLVLFDGTCRFEHLKAWQIALLCGTDQPPRAEQEGSAQHQD